MNVMGGASAFVVLETHPIRPVDRDVGWVTLLDIDDGVGGWALHLGEADQVDVRVHVHSSTPHLSDDAYSEVAEVSCKGAAVLTNDDGERIEVCPDDDREYRVRFSLDRRDASRPTLLVESWPMAVLPPRVMRTDRVEPAGPVHPLLALPQAVDGLSAAQKVGEFIDADWSPEVNQLTGVAQAQVRVPGRARHLNTYFDRARVWTPDEEGFLWKTSRSIDGPTAYMRHEQHPDRLSGWTGAIWSTPHPQTDPPHEMVVWWNWLRPLPGNERVKAARDAVRKVLPVDSVRRVSLEDDNGTVLISVTHSGLPEQWAAWMSDWWSYQLAILADNPRPIAS